MALTVYFNIFGLVGSFIVAQLIHPVPFVEYFSALLRTLQPKDILSTVVKSFVFGIITSVVATFHGFKVGTSVTEIPRAAIKAVGQGFVLCFLADAVITLMYYM